MNGEYYFENSHSSRQSQVLLLQYSQTDDTGGFVWKYTFVEELEDWEASGTSAQLPSELNEDSPQRGIRLSFTCERRLLNFTVPHNY
eukprot:1904176-Amphidinium_carterae.1